MISQHYNYMDTTSHTIVIQLPKYNTTADDICLSIDYKQMSSGTEKNIDPHNHTGLRSPPN